MTKTDTAIVATVTFILGLFAGMGTVTQKTEVPTIQTWSYNIVDYCDDNGYDYVKKQWNDYFCVRSGETYGNEVMIVPLGEVK